MEALDSILPQAARPLPGRAASQRGGFGSSSRSCLDTMEPHSIGARIPAEGTEAAIQRLKEASCSKMP
jgi:hypothetical protein